VEAHDRDRLEALIRYVARPALSLGRLELRGDGKVKWSLRRPWSDGTKAFVFDPLTFIERLAALVPHPREHGWTYFGSLAPSASIRGSLVPRVSEGEVRVPELCPSNSAGPKDGRTPWAQLLQRTFGEDVLRCPGCGGRRHWVATITDPRALARVLAHAGLDPEPEPLAPPRAPPDPAFDFDAVPL
jgi:hypothetical protein